MFLQKPFKLTSGSAPATLAQVLYKSLADKINYFVDTVQ